MSHEGIETSCFLNDKKQKSYQAIETSHFSFYDLYKEKIFCNNTDVSILEEKEKYNDKYFFIVMTKDII